MKARVKRTGEIVEVIQVGSYINEFGTLVGDYRTTDGIMYSSYELDFYIEDNIIIPDYWEKLLHQYAGMAMQGMLADPAISLWTSEVIMQKAIEYATALVKKLKGE